MQLIGHCALLACSLDEAKRNPGCVRGDVNLPGLRFTSSGLRYCSLLCFLHVRAVDDSHQKVL